MSLSSAKFTRRDLLFCAGLAILAFLTFRGVLSSEFLPWDDDVAVTLNPNISGITAAHLKWMFTDTSRTLRYEPLTWLVWSLVDAGFGRSAGAFHCVNLVFHIANTVMVYLVIRRVLAKIASASSTAVMAMAAALGTAVWALHPLRAEVVGWVTQACFAESAFFSLATVLLYIFAVEERERRPYRTWWFWASVVTYAVSLLFFASGVGIAGVLIVLDAFLLRRLDLSSLRWRAFATIIVEKIPFLFSGLIVGVLTIFGRINAPGIWRPPPTFAQFGLLARIAQAAYVFTYYVWKPFDILHTSPVYTNLMRIDPVSSSFLLSMIVVVGVTLVVLAVYRSYPAVACVWAIHLLLIFPFGGYFDYPHYTNDRYAYLDGVLWSAVLAAAMLSLADPLAKAQWMYLWRLVVVAIAIAVVSLGLLTYELTFSWSNGESLFRLALSQLSPTEPYAAEIHRRLGDVYFNQQRYEDAIHEYNSAIRIVPGYPQALIGEAAAVEALSHLSSRPAFETAPSDAR